jgi:transposase
MPYRPYPTPPAHLRDLVGELPADHLARLVEQVVEAFVVPAPKAPSKGNPEYDPRLCAKILIYGYATGTRSSRQLERLCHENLAYLYLCRGDAPSYRTLCTFRNEQAALLEEVWEGLFAVAGRAGLKRVGRIVVDSTKIRANASPEAVLSQDEYAPVRQELQRILSAAQEVDAREDQEGYPGQTQVGAAVPPTQMRDILRQVRRRLAREKREREATANPVGASTATAPKPEDEELPPPSDGGNTPGPPAGTLPEPAAEPTRGSAADAAGGGTEETAPRRLTAAMLARIREALAALRMAEAAALKHLCLTDPDARMMGEGREKKIRECHSFEVAVDHELLVVGQTSQETADNARLAGIVEVAQAHEPEGVKAVTADCGYFAGDGLGRLIRSGIDTCVPDTNTACDLHRGEPVGTQQSKARGSVLLIYEEAADQYRCERGNVLRFEQTRKHNGQTQRMYRAEQSCEGCPLAGQCLTQANAKHRTVSRGEYHEELAAARKQFEDPEHQERYRHRGEAVETVFGFVRGVLGYTRWLLRGQQGVAREGQLFAIAYQIRKIHSTLTIA